MANIKVAFRNENAILLNLRASGFYYLKPDKDYYFTNAPDAFLTYLDQLERLNVTYEITSDKEGVFAEFDLIDYFGSGIVGLKEEIADLKEIVEDLETDLISYIVDTRATIVKEHDTATFEIDIPVVEPENTGD